MHGVVLGFMLMVVAYNVLGIVGAKEPKLLFAYYDAKGAEGIIEEVITEDLNRSLRFATAEAIIPSIPVALAQVVSDPSEDKKQTVSLASVNNASIIQPHNPSDEITPRDEMIPYIVKEGDTIEFIAQEFRVSTNTILWTNNLSSTSKIKPGDQLTILPVSGVRHKAQKGETISSIAKKYSANADIIISYNELPADGSLQEGEYLIIPDGVMPEPVQRKTLPRRPSQYYVSGEPVDDAPGARVTGSAAPASGSLAWPTVSRHISQYFRRGHAAIDIDNRSYPPVFAADNGRVEFAGWRSGYGKTIIVNHGNGMKTLYAHLNKYYVGVGESVAKGSSIAQMGNTGWSTGPHVHFEVWQGGVKRNPLSYY